MSDLMSDSMYLLDNNVLSHLAPEQRAGGFFRDQCRVPSEVIYEAGGASVAGLPKESEYPTTLRVLSILREIMSTLAAGDMTLVDLYANKGNADPMLIACALDAIREGEQFLVRPTWIVVSNDNAVGKTAARFHIESRTRAQFLDETRTEWER